MKSLRHITIITAAVLLLPLFSAGAEITVFAAASLTDVLKELSTGYTKTHGDTFRFNYGASGMLARQIKEGAPADLFISADELRVDQLQKAGLLLSETRKTLLTNTLVIVVPSDTTVTVTDTADLAKPEVRHIAIGEPGTVPVGTYTKEYLQKIALWKTLIDKMVPLDTVRSALAAVESGNAEAGFVYKTDALISKKVKIAFEVPLKEGPSITYPAAVVKDAKNAEAAKAFITFLATPEAQAVFGKYGFLPP